jgi:uncharacterized repeat protein (TIGR01451 family)
MRVRLTQASRAALCALIAAGSLAAGPLQAAPDLELRMSVDVPVPAPAQPVQFTVTVSNVGSSSAAGVVVKDKLPAELAIPVGMAAFVSAGSYEPTTGTWSVGDLAPTGSAVLIIPAVVAVPAQPPRVPTADAAGVGRCAPGCRAGALAGRMWGEAAYPARDSAAGSASDGATSLPD